MNRRDFLEATLASALAASPALAQEKRNPRLLLRSSWQTVNIGDVGHTPGVLRLLDEHVPQAAVSLWPGDVGDGVEQMLRRHFPKLAIAQAPDSVTKALAECDFLLHGSGPFLVGAAQLTRWRQETGKPYGIYGITLSSVDAETRGLIDGARFAFFRDSVSLQLARDQGCRCPVMEFGPDGAFAFDLRNEEAATAFLRSHGLEDGRFLCCIPRLRHTPYWLIRKLPMSAEDERKHARSESMKEHDHSPLREAIVEVVRKTPLKVLVCPEDRSQMAVGKEMIVDRLPEDARARVVWREEFWLPDEAASTYARSAGLFGLEMHSPIMCIGNGVPAIVCRFAEQTSKGMMWRDIGLGDWLFDIDQDADVEKVVPTVLAMARDPSAARAKADRAREFVRRRQRETMGVVRTSIPT